MHAMGGTSQDDAEETRPEEEVGKGKKAKQNKDQTQMRISDMKVKYVGGQDRQGNTRQDTLV